MRWAYDYCIFGVELEFALWRLQRLSFSNNKKQRSLCLGLAWQSKC